LTVKGTAGATRVAFGPDGIAFAAVAAVAASDGCSSAGCELGAKASETGGLESTVGVGAFCGGTGVDPLLVALDTALSLTGSSDVGFGGCIWFGGEGCC
jgi:hypothetical protein